MDCCVQRPLLVGVGHFWDWGMGMHTMSVQEWGSVEGQENLLFPSLSD